MHKFNVVAHRGASRYAVDNTLASFALAKKHGATMIETDIRRSADDRPVVFHDAVISVPNFGLQRIDHMSLASIQATSLAEQAFVPAWEDVLALCISLDMGIYVEIKDASPTVLTEIVGTIRDAGWLERSVLFGPRPDHVFAAKRLEPKLTTGYSYRDARMDPITLARACECNALNLAWEDYPDPCSLITQGWLERVRGAGLRLMSWHEERISVLQQLVTIGIEDICTNDPLTASRLVLENTEQR